MATNLFRNTNPELPGVRLRFGVRAPIVGHVLILTGDLTAVAAITNREIYSKYFHYFFPPSTIQASTRSPAAASYFLANESG